MIRIAMVVVALAACGKGDKSDKGPSSGATNADGDELPRNGACDTRAKNNMCVEYFGQPGTEPGIKESVKKNCAAAEGAVLEKCGLAEEARRRKLAWETHHVHDGQAPDRILFPMPEQGGYLALPLAPIEERVLGLVDRLIDGPLPALNRHQRRAAARQR